MSTRLEDLKPDALAKGLLAGEVVRIVSAEMLGDAACRVVYRGQDGALGAWAHTLSDISSWLVRLNM